MGIKPGERQAERSRSALKAAFGQLLETRGYAEISVGEIADAANVGRSTFYRHFKSKADVLVALHESMFERLFLQECTEDRWIGEEPPQSLRDFLRRHCAPGGTPTTVVSSIGADMDYLMRNVGELLSCYIGRSLQQAFPGKEPAIPLPFVSSAIAATYGVALMSWRGPASEGEEVDLAECIHRLTRATVMEGYGIS